MHEFMNINSYSSLVVALENSWFFSDDPHAISSLLRQGPSWNSKPYLEFMITDSSDTWMMFRHLFTNNLAMMTKKRATRHDFRWLAIIPRLAWHMAHAKARGFLKLNVEMLSVVKGHLIDPFNHRNLWFQNSKAKTRSDDSLDFRIQK